MLRRILARWFLIIMVGGFADITYHLCLGSVLVLDLTWILKWQKWYIPYRKERGKKWNYDCRKQDDFSYINTKVKAWNWFGATKKNLIVHMR